MTLPPERDRFIRVRGARENNLRAVDVDVPRDSLVAFTGVSGSGKSSLAFGTIYAEAQRRYFESVAPYARRLIRQVGAPRIDSLTGLPPAVALQQQRGAASSRSTVGTLTTLSNSLRMLFSRAGRYPRGAKERLEAEAFSPNTAAGACPSCHGLGRVHTVTERSLVPDPSLSIRDGAIAAWPGAWQGKNLRDIVIALGIDVDKPFSKLPRSKRDWLLFTDEQPVVEVEPGEDRNEYGYNGKFVSAKRHVLQTLASSPSDKMRERALRYVVSAPCATCGGKRIQPAALAVTFAGYDIAELNALPLSELSEVLQPTAALVDATAGWESPDSGEKTQVAVTIARDLCARLNVLIDLGLGYLSVDRSSPTLSPGETQRLRIATQLRSGLFGVVYVLDEPSAGLHPADAEPLFAVLEHLKQAGNSLLVVEHNMELVRRADWIVDVGPGAGERGGRVLYSGPVAGLQAVQESVTRRYLPGASRASSEREGTDGGAATSRGADRARARLEAPESDEQGGTRHPLARSVRQASGWLQLRGITRHNLKGLDARLPLGVLTAVTGVSGSGKSTLVSQVLPSVVARALGVSTPAAESGEELEPDDAAGAGVTAQGLERIQRLVVVDQKPIGRTPRSNLATYTGLFDSVRKLFAATPAAKRRGWGAGRFSFNVSEGRCETCQGEGYVSVELMYLPGTYAPCPTCKGARYAPDTLRVQWQGKNIAEVLGMTVEEAAEFFRDEPGVARSLQTLLEVGLGYLRLGQPAPELSGGEAQRIKLASELQRSPRGHGLYILDEPTNSLHPSDIELLMQQLHRLVDADNSVILVEHDLRVIADVDWMIDLGPAGGTAGGQIIATGPPNALANDQALQTTSRTVGFLAKRRSRS